jgi:hypothetical protein
MRIESPACYVTRRIGDSIVSCRLGPHSVDTRWPWWQPWEPLSDPLSRTIDGAHPTLTWTPIDALTGAEPA